MLQATIRLFVMERVNQPSHWVHDFSPYLIRFTEDIGISYYGLSYLLGFLLGGLILRRAADGNRLSMSRTEVADLLTILIIGVLVGGRIGYFMLYEPIALVRSPWVFFKVWQGGMAFHGGLAGVAIGVAWFVHRRHLSFLQVTDAVVTAAPPGLLLVRIASFLTGELWGKITDVPWAVIFSASAPKLPPIMVPPRHPSQLYEAALEGLVLWGLTAWRYWRTDVPIRQPGRLTGEFLVAYAILRSLGEVFREPDAPLLLGLSRGTAYSAVMALLGIGLILRSRKTAALK